MNDRKRLIDILYEGFYISPENDIKGTAQKAADYLIANGVTVQKHGRWKFVDDYTGRCTKCHEESIIDWEYEYKFCPECGAIMDGEADG